MDKKDNQMLKNLLREREKLLILRPELHILEFEIDRKLLEAGNDPIKRMLLMNKMLIKHVNKALLPAIKTLKEVSHRLKQKLDTLQGQKSTFTNSNQEEKGLARDEQIDNELS